jgi:Holliday junction resolvase RusA-like endonuclease
MISFDIVGDPAAQGSKKAFVMHGKARMVEAAGAKHTHWRNAVADAARTARDQLDAALDGPLKIDVQFRFKMPASRSSAVRQLGWMWKVSAPDADKLLRSLGDGLQAGGLITDDARIVFGQFEKVEVLDQWTGAHVEIGPMS